VALYRPPVTVCVRESAQSWKELLLDLKRRGLAMGPELAVADGALGFWQAVEEVWPRTRGQRCWCTRPPMS
jgi:putative transposase